MRRRSGTPGIERHLRWLTASFFLVLTFLSPVAGFAQQPPAPPAAFVTRSDDELLLLAVTFDRQVLTEELPSYVVGERVLLPVGYLAQLLSLAITADVSRGVAEGFVINENRPFLLDARGRKVVVSEKETTLPPDAVEVHQDDIYVDSRLISQWWPVDLTLNMNASLLTVSAREQLPSQLRRDRESRIQRVLGMRGQQRAGYPEHPHPYRLFGMPFIDPTLSLGWRPSADEDELTHGITGFASADLLYAEANAYFSYLDGDRQDFRAALGRRDPDATLLGPLRAREFAIGDVYSPGSDLLTNGGLGRGFTISNYPLVRQSQFDRHTFRGDLPIGWEVELYQNNALIAYQQSRPDGLYEFVDVPLLFGQNIFRLLFYGPEGQQREEIVRFDIDEALTPPGETNYRISKFDDRRFPDRWLAQVEHGVNRNLSITGAAGLLGYSDDDEEYGKVGINTLFSKFSARFETAFDRDGGHAELFGLKTRLGLVDLSATHTIAHELRSEYFRSSFGEDSLDERTLARADIQLPLGESLTLPLTFEARREGFTDGRSLTEIVNRISGQWRGTFVTHELRMLEIETPQGTGGTDRLLGRLLASRRLRDVSARGEIIYDARDAELEAVEASAEKRLAALYLAQAGVRHNLAADSTTWYLNLNKSEGRYALRLLTQYERNAGLSISTVVSLGSYFDPGTRRWHTDARSMASQGSASVFVYVDDNGNRRHDEGERTLEGVGFFIDRTSARQETDRRGVALLTGLPTGQKVEISASLTSQEDAMYKADPPGYTVLPRSGSAVRIEFPVVAAVEAVGTVFIRRGDVDRREASGIQLQLVNEQRSVIATTTTGYDGFFEFTGLTPGAYVLRVDPDQVERLGITSAPELQLDLRTGGTLLEGLELELQMPLPQ